MRRGVLFSMLTLLIAAFLVVVYLSAFSSPELADRGAGTRVTIMDDYVRQWEEYAAAAAGEAARAALLHLTQNNSVMASTYTVEAVKSNLTQCLINATQNLTSPGGPCYPNENLSLRGRLDTFAALADDDLDVSLDYELSGVSVADYAPFQLAVAFSINYTMLDPLFAKWNRSRSVARAVSVEGLPDPLWAHHATGVHRPASRNRTIREDPVPRSLMTKENMSSMIGNETYTAHEGYAPSYLERFAGIYTVGSAESDKAGIETLTSRGVYLPAAWAGPGIDWYNGSYTDHQMFRSSIDDAWFECGNETLGANGVPDFRMTPERLARYGVDDSSEYNYTCS